jgi:hypothetical protein
VSYSSEVLADSPRGYWRMNEASGNPQDSSGNGLHMDTTTGTPIYSQTGAITSDSTATAIRLDIASSESFTASDNALLHYGDTFSI